MTNEPNPVTEANPSNSGITLAALHGTLARAVTEYDRKESTKRGHNRYALAMYLGAVQDICSELAAHPEKLTRSVIIAHLNGRLCDNCLRACAFPIQTKDELIDENKPLSGSGSACAMCHQPINNCFCSAGGA